MDNFREWLSDHLRYILLGLAIILVLVITIFAARLIRNAMKGEGSNNTNVQVTENQNNPTDETGQDQTGESETTGNVTTNLTENDPEILALVQKYYKAHQENDTATLEQIVNPYTEEMENGLGDDSIVSYNNIKTYSEAGPKEGSYIVCVYYEQQIENLDSMIPQLALLYLRTDDDGFLYVADPNEDEETTQAVESFSEEDEIVAIINDTKKKTIELRDSDEGVKNWLEQMADLEGETQGESETNQSSGTIMYANTDDVNVRAEANTDSDVLTMLSQGDEVTVLGDAGDGWSNVEVDGVTGYVATEYLSAQQ